MNLTRCENGHYYDADAYVTCPHCQGMDEGDRPTVALTEDRRTEAIPPVILTPPTSNPLVTVPLSDDQKTVRYYEEAENIAVEPVVGWMVCVEGMHIGEDYKLKAGKNFIGRSEKMDIILRDDNTVSRERHATVIYEPKSRTFIAQPGDSRELFYLNDEVVLVNEKMKAKDVLTIGKTKLMLIPCCDNEFCWEDILEGENK